MANRFQDYPLGRKVQVVCGVACIAVGGAALLVICRSSVWLLQTGFALQAASVPVSLAALVAFVAYVVWATRAGKLDPAFSGLRAGQIHRSRSDRRIAGVCSGLSEYYGVEAQVVRIIALLLFCVMPFLAMLAYVLLASVLPLE